MSNKMYMQDGKLVVPDHVVIPFIEGDGVGAEITPVCQKIVNTAVELAYVASAALNGKRCWPAERLLSRLVNGCRRLRWKHLRSIW